jgi:single-stranded-DNA-specific exonuclease
MQIKYQTVITDDDLSNKARIINLFIKLRGIKKSQEFLQPTHPRQISLDEFGFKKELNITLKLLEQIKKNHQMIIVYTDYDADGITGGAIVWETLYLLGFNTLPYVPHRQKEGYGFCKKTIDYLKQTYNPALIISVDHGISAWEKIDYAQKLGIKVIVTDHHLKPEKIPQAQAIFHLPILSGAGIAYFFAKAIFDYFQSDHSQLKTYFDSDYLSLATIGIIADLVPLIGPARSIVKYGLESFSQIKRLGIKKILEEAGINNKQITPYEIGFIIAPRLNALGRLEHALDALRLICTKDEQKARTLAKKVSGKNQERQQLVEECLKEAEQEINNHLVNNQPPKIIILQSDRWHEGIIGLIAAKIAERYYRPTIIITKSDGIYKGSARSISNFHITNFLLKFKRHLIDVGGHQQAAGFSIDKHQVVNLIKHARQNADHLLQEQDLIKTIRADVKINFPQVSLRLAQALTQLKPFGIGNPEPTFYSEGKLIDAKIFGKKNEHLKIFAQQENTTVEMLFFYQADLFSRLAKNSSVKTVYKIGVSQWQGREKVTLLLNHLI